MAEGGPSLGYYLLTSLLLAGLLSYPMSRMIWVMSVRRLQRKLERELETREIRGQRARAWFLAILLASPFAFLFNYYLLLQVAG